MPNNRLLLGASAVILVSLGLSGIAPYDRTTWLMEVAPIFIALPILWFTQKSFPLTPLLYGLISIHAVILCVGGAYTYARVPAGFWIQELLDLSRNPYDKLGHFAQGFIPTLVAREILLRCNYLTKRGMAAFLCVCIALAISACYEIIEWWSALALGQGADEFLGTQGNPWDTQSDMLLALVGSVTAMLTLSKRHDLQIAAQAKPILSKLSIPYDALTWITTHIPAENHAEASKLLSNATDHTGAVANDRLIRCAAVASRGDIKLLREYVGLLRIDYRDVIVAGEYDEIDGKLTRVRDLTQPITS